MSTKPEKRDSSFESSPPRLRESSSESLVSPSRYCLVVPSSHLLGMPNFLTVSMLSFVSSISTIAIAYFSIYLCLNTSARWYISAFVFVPQYYSVCFILVRGGPLMYVYFVFFSFYFPVQNNSTCIPMNVVQCRGLMFIII